MKNIVLCLFLLVTGTLGFGQESSTLNEGLNRGMTEMLAVISERAPGSSNIRIRSFSAPTQIVSNRVIEILGTIISNNRQFNLVATEQTIALVRDEQQSQSSFGNQDDFISVDNFDNAHIIITGTLTRINLNCVIHLEATLVGKGVALVQKDITIRIDDTLAEMLNISSPNAWKHKRFSVGGRFGVAPHFYTLSEDDIDGVVDANHVAFEFGFQGAVYITDYIAVQIETLFTSDTVKLSGIEEGVGSYTASYTSKTLTIPLLARLSLKPDIFSVSLLVGPYFTLPLGQMELSSDKHEDTSYDFSVPLGFMAGVNLGIHLGPGVLGLDVRYAVDTGRTSIHDGHGNMTLYNRSSLSFTLGYEIGLIGRSYSRR
ncbi:MAG: PorT family protein [Treponema sp.]|nr:PorT family protein [Treponema sp.]